MGSKKFFQWLQCMAVGKSIAMEVHCQDHQHDSIPAPPGVKRNLIRMYRCKDCSFVIRKLKTLKSHHRTHGHSGYQHTVSPSSFSPRPQIAPPTSLPTPQPVQALTPAHIPSKNRKKYVPPHLSHSPALSSTVPSSSHSAFIPTAASTPSIPFSPAHRGWMDKLNVIFSTIYTEILSTHGYFSYPHFVARCSVQDPRLKMWRLQQHQR